MTKQYRSLDVSFSTRNSDDKEMIIEGYFALFNKETEIWQGYFEQLDKDAFKNTLGETSDIRALFNHDTNIVLGRTKTNTLKLYTDEKGLYGIIHLNKNDVEARNIYERVKRGDIDQCSFGFVIKDESIEYEENGAYHSTIKEVELFEVSIVTFPAYADTSISARMADFKNANKRKMELWKTKLKERIKG